MLEGGGVREYTKAKALLYADPPLFTRFDGDADTGGGDFLQLQIDAGADAVQVFDSLGGVLSEGDFARASGRWMKQIVTSLKGQAPVIVFSKGRTGTGTTWWRQGRRCWVWIGMCAWRRWRARLPERVGVQGNLDPFPAVHHAGSGGRRDGRNPAGDAGRPGHIFNLGHGVRRAQSWRISRAWFGR